MNPAAIYQIDDLTKLYGTRAVLSIAQLEIERGRVFCVVGPSGAGKSTLLRLLNFLESPTSGTVRFDGAKLNGNIALDVRRRVTTVFQKPILLHGTVEQNVGYGLRVRGIKHSASKTAQVLEQVGLAGLVRAPARTLSGGEIQRVALARAIVIEPEVLLLDEPTANLDPYNVSLIEKIVTDLNRERGTTIVMVTHNVFQAKRLAQRAMLLLGGKSIEVAEAGRFFSAPSDSRTAAFVRGDMVY
jgi:tungstate transport system ATP-binding protein